MEVIIKYECPVCKKQYLEKEEAERCMNTEFKPNLEVGEIVKLHPRFGWYDGKSNWIQSGSVGDVSNLLSFYYVVTEIDRDKRDPHRVRYHVATMAMSPQTGYHRGYTFDEGHFTPQKVENPQFEIIEDSKQLIGLKSNHLLS